MRVLCIEVEHYLNVLHYIIVDLKLCYTEKFVRNIDSSMTVYFLSLMTIMIPNLSCKQLRFAI
jgi:hypothetical protein